MAELREPDGKVSGVKEAWLNRVYEMKRIFSERFSWFSLTEVSFTEVGCVSDEEIDHFQRHVNQLFPDISMDKLQKTHVREIQSYVSWKKKYCKEEHYVLQIKSCMNPTCCIPTKLNQEELKWLPLPILDSSGLHYLPYDKAKLLKKADDRDRPSIKIKKETKPPRNSKNELPSSTSVEKESVDLTSSIPMTAQNARAVV